MDRVRFGRMYKWRIGLLEESRRSGSDSSPNCGIVAAVAAAANRNCERVEPKASAVIERCRTSGTDSAAEWSTAEWQ